jgi:hypothetical protein
MTTTHKSTTDVYECEGMNVVRFYNIQEGSVTWTVMTQQSERVTEEQAQRIIKLVQHKLGVY